MAMIGLADPPGGGTGSGVRIAVRGEEIELWPNFAQQHNLRNLLAAVAAATRARADAGRTPRRSSSRRCAGSASGCPRVRC